MIDNKNIKELKKMYSRKKALSTLLVLTLIMVSFGSTFAFAGQEPMLITSTNDSNLIPPSQLVVSGHGTVTSIPDQAIINLGTVTVAKTALEAQQENNKIMNNFRQKLNALGISKENITTSNFNVWPEYVRPEPLAKEADTEPKISGYRLSNNLRVTVNNLNLVGKVIDTAIGEGINNINGLQFTKQDTSTIKNEVLTQAVQDAQRKANLLANLLNVKLVRVLNFSENGAAVPYNYMDYRMKEASFANDVAIEPGQLETSGSVQIVYEIAPK